MKRNKNIRHFIEFPAACRKMLTTRKKLRDPVNGDTAPAPRQSGRYGSYEEESDSIPENFAPVEENYCRDIVR